MARLMLFAGPNGSGKSTLARQLAPDWIIPDAMPGANQIAKGRAAISAVRSKLDAADDVAMESTLSGQWTLVLVADALARSYVIHLHFVGVSSATLAEARIERRVRQGGHDVPKADQAGP